MCLSNVVPLATVDDREYKPLLASRARAPQWFSEVQVGLYVCVFACVCVCVCLSMVVGDDLRGLLL